MEKFQSFFDNVIQTLSFKQPKQKQYAKPTQSRTILGYLACAVFCFECGGWYEDAQAFKQFCFDVCDSDKAEEAFAVDYDIGGKNFTSDQFYDYAVLLTKQASIELHYQKDNYGEDNWDLFLREIKAMRVRERVRKQGREKTLERLEDRVTKIRDGDEAVIADVRRRVKLFEESGWAWNWNAEPTGDY